MLLGFSNKSSLLIFDFFLIILTIKMLNCIKKSFTYEIHIICKNVQYKSLFQRRDHAFKPIIPFACGDDPKDTDEPTVVDADNDGYGEDWDCDDNDANVFPSNTETCDGIDNNCDGYIDEDLTVLYYADDDGDGFGDETSYQESCEACRWFC